MQDQIIKAIKLAGNEWSKYGLVSIGTVLSLLSSTYFIQFILRQPDNRTLYVRSLFLDAYSGNQGDAEALIGLSNSIMADNYGRIGFLLAAGAVITTMSWKRHGTNFKLRITDPWYLRPIFVLAAIFSLIWSVQWLERNKICSTLKENQEVLRYISQSATLHCNIDYANFWLVILFFWIIFLASKQTIGKWLNKVGCF